MGDSIKTILGGVSEQIGTYLPNIAAAIGVLVVGWLVAHLIGRIVRLAVSRTGIDDRLASMLSISGKTDMARVIGKAAFYLAMLFVFVTFFNVLDLSVVSKPLSSFLDQIFAFAPQLISAVVLGGVGWGLATVARLGSRSALEAINIDQRIASVGQDVSSLASTAKSLGETALQTSDDLDSGEVNFDDADFTSGSASDSASERRQAPVAKISQGESVKLSQTIPEAAYWLVLFLFLPAILGALKIPGLLEPIQGMFEKALGYLPNLFGAAVILAVGFLVAKILRQVVTNLTASFGADRLGTRLGLTSENSSTKISSMAGVLAYATVLMPILVAAVNTLGIDAVTQPASAVLEKITSAIPGLIGGAVVLGISFFVAKLLSGIATDLLKGVGFDQLPQKLGIVQAQNMATPPSAIAGKVLIGVMMLLATMQALPMMGLDSFAGQLDEVAKFGMQVFVGLVILGFGYYLGNLAAGVIRDSGVSNAKTLATIARVAIVVFTGAMGLERMGLSSSIINVAFSSLLGGLGLASAIAFGWGGRDAAKRLLDRYIS